MTLCRWVQGFTPLIAEAARPRRHAVGDRWFVDETYVKVNGSWRYVFREVDQHGQVIDVLVSIAHDLRRPGLSWSRRHEATASTAPPPTCGGAPHGSMGRTRRLTSGGVVGP